jgi:hypothetical protein
VGSSRRVRVRSGGYGDYFWRRNKPGLIECRHASGYQTTKLGSGDRHGSVDAEAVGLLFPGLGRSRGVI